MCLIKKIFKLKIENCFAKTYVGNQELNYYKLQFSKR